MKDFDIDRYELLTKELGRIADEMMTTYKELKDLGYLQFAEQAEELAIDIDNELDDLKIDKEKYES